MYTFSESILNKAVGKTVKKDRYKNKVALAFDKEPFQFWQEIWIQVVVILMYLYVLYIYLHVIQHTKSLVEEGLFWDLLQRVVLKTDLWYCNKSQNVPFSTDSKDSDL